MAKKYSDEYLDKLLDSGESYIKLSARFGVGSSTLERRAAMRKIEKEMGTQSPQISAKSPSGDETPDRADMIPKRSSLVKELFIDIETLPNRGYFFDVFSDRGIPLDFIENPKSICTLAYKFAGELTPTVLIAHEPYNDRSLLIEFSQIILQADYVIAHFGDGFDMPFIEGRLFANGLPALPPVATIDTYKLARNKFKKTLNSNKLDHLAKICGLQGKNKTSASLWVGCAQGDLGAIKEMAEYNAQDIEVLEQVYNKLKTNVKSKRNANVIYDDAVLRCKTCDSTNLELKGYEMKASTFQHRYQCCDCTAWTTTPAKKGSK